MSKHSLTWIAIIVVITTMFLKLPPMVAKQDAVLRTYGALVEVDALARQKYVEPVLDDRLVHGAIRGMMMQLDPYSGYIAPNELPAFERRNDGEYIGIGVELGYRDGHLEVVAPIEESPAALAGILAGDTLLAIDGRDVEGYSVFDVEELLAGPPGSSVRLEVLHPGDAQAHEIDVIRGAVTMTTVRGFARDTEGNWIYLIDEQKGIGYIRISSFLGSTMREFDAVTAQLLRHDRSNLILDLRFNPGGIMKQAIAMVDRFIDGGSIVSTVNRRNAVHDYRARPRTPLANVGLVVLVNGATASAAEIVAGALQDHGRAKIIGQRTFGKGCVQHMIYLTEHAAAVSLTTAYYRLPNGRIIHRTPKNRDSDHWGVTPDREVYLSESEVRAIAERRREIDRRNVALSPSGPAADSEVYRDPQLRDALALLRQALATHPPTRAPSTAAR